MAASIADLLRGKPDPVTTSMETHVKDILAIMIKHDYSQLPVVDQEGTPVGLVTSDSIVRALHNFGVKTDELCVKDAMLRRPETYYDSDDVFDLLDHLGSSDVGFVIDAHGKLSGIVTTYDTTAYLRQRVQDIMVVQEIEEMVKSYTTAAFTTPSGDVDDAKQRDAIEGITPSNTAHKGKFGKAMQHYLSQCGESKPKINQANLDAAFMAHLHEKPAAKPFDELTLGEYINLFLHQSRWSSYSSIFTIDREAIRRLLNAVRQTRNALAHFRDDITPQQREELRFCREWLARHENAVASAFGLGVAGGVPVLAEIGSVSASSPVDVLSQTNTNNTASLPPTSDETLAEETAQFGESRYAPLIQSLTEKSRDIERVTLTFDEVDALLGEHKLPDSARKYRAWWANDSVSHTQSQQWLDAGWRVAGLSVTDERVTFTRSKERERAYIEFFSALLHNLEAAAPHTFKIPSPDGQSWINVGWPLNGLALNFSFTQTKRFRVELYIDVGNKAQNKQIFDMLHERRARIEQEFGEPLSWERIDDKRASRIARYYPGVITDNKGTLTNLGARAVEAMLRFRNVLERHLNEVVPPIVAEQPPSVETNVRERHEEPVR